MPIGFGDPPETDLKGESSIRSDERRRIAREVHDSTAQLLVVLELHLGRLKRCNLPEAQPAIEECERVIHEIREQIRALDLD